MSGTVLAIISDSHVGSSTALAPLEFNVHSRSENEVQKTSANKLQRWLYECWTDYWDHVFKLAKKKRLVVVHCGDLIDGLHHGSLQVMNEVEDQVAAFKVLMQPILERADGFYGVLGTGPSHAGIDNSTEAQIYRDLKAIEFGQTLTLSVDGVIHDFAHHGRAGSRPWTSGGAGLASEVLIDYALSRLPLPNFIWRGHRHVVDDSGNRIPGSRAISLPSWQLKTSFGYRVSGNTVRSDIGGYVVVDGLLDESKSRYLGQPDQRRIIIA